MPPTANAGAPPANITFASLPTSVPLDGSGSTPGAGSIITWAWAIQSKPPGSTVSLSSSTVANPTLNNVDLPGTYLISLNVEDSVDGWAWDPDPASGGYENTPNDMPTARIYIAVEQEYTATVPPALGERTMQGLSPGDVGYTSAWAKWLALWYAVDALQGELDAFTASPSFDDLYVDNIYEKTLGHTIVLKDDVTSEGSIFIALGEALSTTAITTPISQDLTIGAGDDISITATGDLTMGAGGPVAIAAGAAQSVTITGGALYPDLLVNEIDPSSGATITVNGIANVDAGGGVHRLDTTEATGQLKLTAAGDESSPFTFNLSVYGTTSLKGRAQVEAGMDVDVIDQLTTAGLDITGANGVRVNHAEFTGTTAANSTMAISGITADDSGAVFISLDGAGNLITAQATTVSLASGSTLKADTIGEVTAAAGVTVDGLLIKDGVATGQVRGYFYANTSTQTLNNPTSFTPFNTANCTIPVVVQAGDRIRVSYMLYAEGGISTQFDHQVKFGSVVVGNPAGATNIDDAGNISGSFMLRVATGGASSVLDVHPATVTRDGPSASVSPGGGAVALAGPDFTAAVNVTVEGMFGASSGGNTTTLYDLNVEVIRPT